MRGEIRSRLSDSIENALRLADGHLVVVVMPKDADEYELEFSQSYACEEHGISFGELEPRMFSFNNPAGACDYCLGIGEINKISVDKIIPNKELSLDEGAIAVNGFKSLEEESWNGPLFRAVGEKVGFSLSMPIKDFSETALNALLYGTGNELYSISRYFGGEDAKLQNYRTAGGDQSRKNYVVLHNSL